MSICCLGEVLKLEVKDNPHVMQQPLQPSQPVSATRPAISSHTRVSIFNFSL